jgi:hypothetical protein
MAENCYEGGSAPPEGMRTMDQRRPGRGFRELRLVVPDARLRSVRRRVADQVARLNQASEEDALNWIEAVSEFDFREEPPIPSTR